MTTIHNPILPGFNPDPSIVRVGGDFYTATSTFEWFPGVQIHHSRDLKHWRLLTHPLDRVGLLDMEGNPSSGGIWAPCLTHHNGVFHLIYTDVKSLDGAFKDTPNYLTTAEDIMGPWSDPVYLNSSGFDPSMFHDDDGRKWLVNQIWDFRRDRNSFAGIALQEYSPERKRLVGEIRNIFKGTELGVTEGPHIYKRDGLYYLMTAEGGTGHNHAVTLARAEKIEGPYEVHPENPVLTSRNNPGLELRKAGHASITDTPNGEWYMVHLCSRPVGEHNRCILGRETAIQKVKWCDDGWLRLEAGGNEPLVEVPAPDLPEHAFPAENQRDDFDSTELGVHFATLRVPTDNSWLSLTERPGWLRLYGRESLQSKHRQSLVARRVQAFKFRAETCIEFSPENFQQMAGLTAFYDVQNNYYLRVSADDGRSGLNILVADDQKYDEALGEDVDVTGTERLFLAVQMDREELQFSYSLDGGDWTDIGPALDSTILSDEYGSDGRFTGAFVGICAQDLAGTRKHADFDYFEYEEK